MKPKYDLSTRFFFGSLLPILLQLIIIIPIIEKGSFNTGGGLEGAGALYSMEVLYLLVFMPTSFILTFIGTANSRISLVNSFLFGCSITIILPLSLMYIDGFPIYFSEPPFTG